MENKKENIKPNEVAAPTLFVGVGGTGCKIVKKVADLCAPEEKENINLAFENLMGPALREGYWTPRFTFMVIAQLAHLVVYHNI